MTKRRRLAATGFLIIANALIVFLYFQIRQVTFLSLENNTILWNANFCANFLSRSHVYSTLNNGTSATTKWEYYSHQPVFPHLYKYIIKNDNFCTRNPQSKNKLSLLILVCSAVHNFQQRKTIRETWGSVAAINGNNTGAVRLAFLLGVIENSTVQKLVFAESSQFEDLIQENFYDSYRNLTIKSVMLLKWVTEHCLGVHFVMKTDDDIYINVNQLLIALEKLPVRTKGMYGLLLRKTRPNRIATAKWFVPKEQYALNVYPDYLAGCGYVISRDVIPKLFEESQTLPFLVMEDVFITGLCACKAGVQLYNVENFTKYTRSPTACTIKNAITWYHVTIKDMSKIWNELKLNLTVCRPPKKGFWAKFSLL